MKGSAGSPNLPSKLSLDSSVLLAYFLGEDLGAIAKEIIFQPGRSNHTHHLAIAETFYILCRQKGENFARDALDTLAKSRYVAVHESLGLDHSAGEYKCSRNISLADSYLLALAKQTESVALFARHEEELDQEQKRKTLDVKMVYLEDLVRQAHE